MRYVEKNEHHTYQPFVNTKGVYHTVKYNLVGVSLVDNLVGVSLVDTLVGVSLVDNQMGVSLVDNQMGVSLVDNQMGASLVDSLVGVSLVDNQMCVLFDIQLAGILVTHLYIKSVIQ